jgi:hypothetical protein
MPKVIVKGKKNKAISKKKKRIGGSKWVISKQL